MAIFLGIMVFFPIMFDSDFCYREYTKMQKMCKHKQFQAIIAVFQSHVA